MDSGPLEAEGHEEYDQAGVSGAGAQRQRPGTLLGPGCLFVTPVCFLLRALGIGLFFH